MIAVHPALLPSLLGLALAGLLMLRRFQRLATPQPLDERGRRRLVRRPIILLVLAGVVLLVPHSLAAYGAALLGALFGTGLAFWSAHHTRFEYADGQATRYIPNVWIGGGVFLLFVLRLLWRLWPLVTGQVSAAGAQGLDPAAFAGGNPLTVALFVVFVAYQMAYAVLMLQAARTPRLA